MSSRASIAIHPIQPMLTPVPFALWVFSLIGDIIARTGQRHRILNVIALIIFASAWYLRARSAMARVGAGSYTIPFALSIIGNLAISISGLLGSKLVYIHGIGVNPTLTEPPGTPGRS
ncbi:MAG TPA: DUF2231 domain-containing protein [Chthoniobacterales bacterium]